MFFAAILAIPILAGLVAGTFSASRWPAHVLAAICTALGVAGAIAIAVDSATTGRASSVIFAVVAGAVGALLVYGGWYTGRAGMRAIRDA